MSSTGGTRRAAWWWSVISGALLLLGGLGLPPAAPVAAANLTVTACGDAGPGTLRGAIAAANAGDTIVFQAGLNCSGASAIMLATGTLTLAKDLTIDGTGATIVVDGGCTFSGGQCQSGGVTVFAVSSGTVGLTALTIQHGNASVGCPSPTTCGGGVFVGVGAAVTVTNSTFSGNSAGIGGGIYNNGTLTVRDSAITGNSAAGGGGGIYNIGTLTVTNSTFSGNSADNSGGALFSGEAAMLTVTNSTITGNRASTSTGGGIYSAGTLTVTNSTLSGNSAGSGGGIVSYSTLTVTTGTFSGNSADAGGGGIDNQGTATLTNTIVASSTNSGDLSGSFTGNNNLIDDASSAGGLVHGSNGNIVGHPALLGTLGSYGGSIQTIPLLPGSPAIDAGHDATCTSTGTAAVNSLDQRGITRPQPAGGHCDIGAFEARFTLTVSDGNNQTAVVSQPFATPLAVTLGGPDAPADKSGAPVTFTAPLGGASATFTPNPATTNTSGAASVTATANGTKGGPYTVTGSTPGAASVTFSLTNTAPLVSIAVAPANPTLKVGETRQFTATGTYADNGTQDISGQVTWTSDATSIMTVDATGNATGVTPGTVHLTATQGSVTSAPVAVIVTAPTGTGITVNPAPAGRPGGQTSGSGTPPNLAPSPAPPGSGTTGSGPAPNPVPTGR